MPYFVYFLQCADQSLYCGYTKDLSRRIKEHNDSKKGAKYTRAKRPVVLVYSEEYATLSEALRREYQLKQLSNQAKKALIRSKEHV
ncbi:GIY-YIG nuclease family protein [Candidatus Woesebacteria bacterium]|nr:GIY-YIG nuclease family protein [Candidatus Woesebacteria bacterium]